VTRRAHRSILPPRLQDGATIGVVAPASPVASPDRIDTGIHWLESRGFTVVRGRHITDTDGYLAGEDAVRAHDLMQMFLRTDIDAIMCTRGGYGTMRILPLLDYAAIRRHPKIIMGFSDITALSLALHVRTGLLTFAGPMVAAEMAGPPLARTEAVMWDVLFGRATKLAARADGARTLVPGRAEGTLLGGNLALVSAIAGTPFEPTWDGAILFLEDVGEPVYRIDRMLCQLQLAGVLGRIGGAVLGRFTGIPDAEPDRALETVLDEYFRPLGIPVLMDFPFGHTPDKMTLPLGARVVLDTRSRSVLLPYPYVR
jgi:muramoyltetrapeptide carboxypeptidase